MTIDFRSDLLAACQQLSLEPTSQQLDMFMLYAERLHEASQRMNLTAIPPEKTLTHHFLDSLSLLAVWKPASDGSVLDIGTGGGFPGLPLKIMCPEMKITLMDSRHDPIDFLSELVAELGLEKVKCVVARAEEAGQSGDYRGKYDMATARAVAHLWALSEWTLPFVKIGGVAIWAKRRTQWAELEVSEPQIQRLGGGRPEVREVEVPMTDITNSFWLCEKIQATAKGYPRPYTQLSKEVKRIKAC
ncbi:MAG: 16S rRNA (guanine(527)-N(7))-methyltransferase RsmG [Armatimonadota bacterium]